VVYAVTDDRVVATGDFLERARALAQGPQVAIVLRARRPGGPLLDLADRLRTISAASGTRLLVHDRLDVARLTRADGVHLPSDGLPVRSARVHLGLDPLVGRSTHTPAEAAAALTDGADYVFLGNIWETATHPGRPPLGVTAITNAAAHPACPAHPAIIAIGGVTAARAALARAAGAWGVAAVRTLWDAPDPASAVRGLLLSFR
jgi:thiamine-phosphate pyrophosphorylase